MATSDLQGKSRAILVEVNYAKGDRIIITDNEMITTRKNLMKNNQVALLAFEEDYSYSLKILGEAEYHTKDKHFDFVKSLESNKNYSPEGAVVISIKEIIEIK